MLRACLKAAFLLLMLTASALRAEPASVARVALAVGEATRVDAAGRAQPLRLGAQLAAGDRIITGKDAIAILVFSDQGRVSLRADTELVIQRYRVDPAGADTRLELELVRGAMRQISGDAARLQPERYRLNTPVAAIGVRGTDFLAKFAGGAMETLVHEGMIVVSPAAASCAAAGCGQSVTLSASDAGQYLRVLSSGEIERRAINPEDVERLFGIRLAGGDQRAPGVVFVAGGGADAFRSLNGRDGWMGNGSDLASDQFPDLSALPQSPPPGPGAALPAQLVWGRFSSADELPMQLPVAFAIASQGRHVTVGELGRYVLWRDNPSGRLDPGLSGQVQFNLAAAEAVFSGAGGLSEAQVRAASLAVDFDRSAFGAGVTVSHASTGDVAFSVNGRINDEGMFWAGNSAERVAGALSRDGREAGYLFTKEHAQGTFRGVTLWNAR